MPYYVEVQEIQAPPTVIDFIPIIVTATVSADCSGFINNTGAGISDGTSSATVSVNGSQTYNWSANCNGVTTPLHVALTSSATALFGVRTEVLVTQASLVSILIDAVPGGSLSSAGAAMTDPTFQIDPSFPYASYFQLGYSDAGAASVPEPRYTIAVSLVLAAFFIKSRLKTTASKRNPTGVSKPVSFETRRGPPKITNLQVS